MTHNHAHTHNTKHKILQFMEYENLLRCYCDGLGLDSLLIEPIQRLPRYKLILTEIVKYTEQNHKDYNNLKQALDSVLETTTLINERMKEFEGILCVF